MPMQHQNKPKLTADEFIQEYIDPLRALLPYAKINEFTEYAHKIEHAFQRDSIAKTYDFLENQILLNAKERLEAYISRRLNSKFVTPDAKKKLAYKIQDSSKINNLARFITAFQLIEISIEKFEPLRKPSTLDKIKAFFHR